MMDWEEYNLIPVACLPKMYNMNTILIEHPINPNSGTFYKNIFHVLLKKCQGTKGQRNNLNFRYRKIKKYDNQMQHVILDWFLDQILNFNRILDKHKLGQKIIEQIVSMLISCIW